MLGKLGFPATLDALHRKIVTFCVTELKTGKNFAEILNQQDLAVNFVLTPISSKSNFKYT